MSARVRHITIDSADPYALAQFWAAVTGFGEHPENGNAPGDPEALLVSPGDGPDLLFVTVPERKNGKNRVHFDLQPTDRTRDEEVERVRSLGAQVVADHRRPDGSGWVTMADPEGNEFCVERSAAERT
ncbi:VOC family protein [Cryptosporangium minutisporangium]|uniref:VOC family protein n=1 Tax=Cryptosporangium minutisporangium TaxID=113569 RepID=A0ABP6T6P4_9ACTN